MTADPRDALPPRLDPTCTCICHTQPGMMHFAPCCREADPKDAEIARYDLDLMESRMVKDQWGGEWVRYSDHAAEIARLTAENEALRTGDWSKLRLVRFENGQFDFSGSPVQYIAEFFAQVMEDGEGDHFNNVEIQFVHPKAGAMVLTVQRKEGLTPAEQRKKAEADRDAALAQVAVLTEIASDSVEILQVAIDNWNDLYPDEPDEIITDLQSRCRAASNPTAALAALSRRDAQMRAEGHKEGLLKAAAIAYRVCAETRHVTLGQETERAILAAVEKEEDK